MVSKSPARPHRGAFILLGVLLVLTLAIIGFVAWILTSQAGTRTALSFAAARTDNLVQFEGIRGTLLGPLQIERITITQPDQRIVLDDAVLIWRPRALLHHMVHINSLRVRALTITSAIDKQEESEPFSLPEDIGLPVQLRIDELQLDEGSYKRGPATLVAFGPVSLTATYAEHRYSVELKRLGAQPQFEGGNATASVNGVLSISDHSPFPLAGHLDFSSKAQLDERALGTNGTIRFDGALDALETLIKLNVNDALIQGQATLHPLSDTFLGSARLRSNGLDLSALDAALPKTALNIAIDAGGSHPSGAGTVQIENTAPGGLDREQLPLQSFAMQFQQHANGVDLNNIVIALGRGSTKRLTAGSLSGNAKLNNGAFHLNLRTEALSLNGVDARMRPTKLSGTIAALHRDGKQEFTVALNEPLGDQSIQLDAHALLADNLLELRKALLQSGKARLNVSGRMALADKQDFDFSGEFSRFSVHDFGDFEQVPKMLINGAFKAQGALAPTMAADVELRIADSQLGGHPLEANGNVRVRGENLDVPQLFVKAGDNTLQAKGRLAADGDARLDFALDAPALAQIGPGFAGNLKADGQAQGSLSKARLQAKWEGNATRVPGQIQIERFEGDLDLAYDQRAPFSLESVSTRLDASDVSAPGKQLATVNSRLRFSPRADAPLEVLLDAKRLRNGTMLFESITLNGTGTTAQHALDLSASSPNQTWNARVAGGLADLQKNPSWNGLIEALGGQGNINAQTRAPALLALSATSQRLEQLQLQIESGEIVVDQFLREGEQMDTKGRLTQLQLAPFLANSPLADTIKGDLELSGQWNLRFHDTLDGNISVQRERGDLTVIGAAPAKLGLGALRGELLAQRGALNLNAQIDGELIGSINVQAATRLGDDDQPLALAPDAPLSGRATLDVPSLTWLGALIDPLIRTNGRIAGDLVIAGTLDAPMLNGRLSGDDLQVSHAEFGIDMRQGILRSEFNGEGMLLQSLRFEGAEGHVALAGPIQFGAQPQADLTLTAEKFKLLNRPDRSLVLSGNSALQWSQAGSQVKGEFVVNSGYIDIGTDDRPSLGDDVIIVGQEKGPSAASNSSIDVRVRIGGDVQIRGMGLDALLVGGIRIASAPGEALHASGTLAVSKGTVGAYGRELVIERGGIRFNGALTNPTLDILAMLRGQEVEAGVAVQGSVMSPRITLVSEPNVPDAEKLAWIVIGRSLASAGASDVGSLQDAAASLLSQGAAAGVQSRIASAFGLDTFSVADSESLQQRIVSVGKQISSKLYLGYQQGLESAASVVQLRYLLTPKLSIEAEAGARSAFSMFYNISFD